MKYQQVVICSGKASEADIISHHMCAVSTNIEAVTTFGIDKNNIFGFWDWVGGRYSVCSAVGLLPLSIHYSYDVMCDFLKGAHDIDVHTRTADLEKNIPVMLGLIGVWNSTFLKYFVHPSLHVVILVVLFFPIVKPFSASLPISSKSTWSQTENASPWMEPNCLLLQVKLILVNLVRMANIPSIN